MDNKEKFHNTNIQSLVLKNRQQFFHSWLTILQPFLKLRKREIDVLSKILYYNYEIGKDIKNEDLKYELLFSSKIRKQIAKEIGIKDCDFGNILSTLRKKSMIINNRINPSIIPKVSNDFKSFNLVFNLNIKEE